MKRTHESREGIQNTNGWTLYQYMTNKEDAQISALLRHHTGKALYSVSKEATKLEDIEGTLPLVCYKEGKNSSISIRETIRR